MKKEELSIIFEYIETHQDAVFAEFAQNNFDVDGRIRVGPDHKKLNCLRRKMVEMCEEGE